MKLHSVEGCSIKALGTAVPRRQVSIAEYAPQLVTEKQAKRLAKGTGFAALRVSDDNTTAADLCEAAARQILTEEAADDIGGLVFVTQTPDYVLPATSHVLQSKFGLQREIVCIDINQGCSGYVEGLYAASLLCRNLGENVLLLAGDTVTKLTSPSDRATRVIFGDGGSATLLSPTGGQCTDAMAFFFASLGEQYSAITAGNMLHGKDALRNIGTQLSLQGEAVMEFTLNDVYAAVQEFCRSQQLKVNDFSLLAFHQANKMILSALAEKLGVSPDKLPFTAETLGNTSSASIPLVLEHYAASPVLDRVMCCGFGVGLSMGICQADFSQTKFYQTVEI